MNRFNPFIFILVLFIISVAWFTQNNSYILMYYNDGYSSVEGLRELFYYMNSSASGYSSIQNYSLVLLFPFLLVLQHFFKQQNISEILRFKYRGRVYLKELQYVFWAALIISLMHTLVNITGSFIFFNVELVIGTKMIEYSFLNALGLTLFYFFVGLIFCIIQHFIKSESVSMLATLLMIGGLFFVSKMLIPNYWTPLRDLTIMTRLFEGETDILGIGWIYLKQIIIIVIFYLLGSISSGRRDFISET
ncbi:WxPxxD family membrane protein [Alkalihalobacillus sp. LMS39]|uniref:WxPxxD family membrane protein n=1 Tax=Alkalihalobacillus sp. LMS39 TaxID=2924032 RepID=UPI001FB32939|nr:WxPxxD family membrane protein [Alkalihalobacillus sp. LMS39]UOE94412.1 WxPxxD family membrane protein [Alkalihalobacillus sp. LMS39]